MRDVSEIEPFSNEIEIVHLKKARIIGREIRCGGTIGNTAKKLWDEVYTSGQAKILSSLPKISPSGLFGWTMEYEPQTKTFIYMVCALTPPDTGVPKEFTYRDINETDCAISLYGESVYKTLQKIKNLGYTDNWSSEGCGWNAELYFDEEENNPPKKANNPWHWLIPIRR